jgi:Mg-chelatase subunit ChlD
MKDKINTKGILSALIIITVLCLGTNTYGSSEKEGQVVGVQKGVLDDAPKGDSQTRGQSKLDIVFVLDNSGSMMTNDPEFITKNVVINFLNNIDEGFRFGMVIYDQEAKLVEPLMGINTPEAAARFLKSVDRIDFKGKFTNTPAGVERAIYELKTHGRKEARKVIILLTDGIVDTGDKVRDLEKERWLREDLSQESKKAGIQIFGIAFTDKADFRLIQTLALKTNGEYFRAYSAEDIPGVFKRVNEVITKPLVQIEPLIPAAPPPKIEPFIPAIEKPLTPSPVPTVEDKPAEKKTDLLPIILNFIIIITLGILVYVMIFKGKSGKRVKTGAYSAREKVSLPPDHPVFKAELIDAENVTTKDSLSFPLNKESVSIGRDTSNDIVIPKESVSSLHATIEHRNGYFYLEDHRSTNRTRLNYNAIKENEPVRLKSGDKIHIAVYEFRFLLHDQAPLGETVMLDSDEE